MPFASFIFQPFLHSATWNMDVMAGTLTSILESEVKSFPSVQQKQKQEGTWVPEYFVEQNWPCLRLYIK